MDDPALVLVGEPDVFEGQVAAQGGRRATAGELAGVRRLGEDLVEFLERGRVVEQGSPQELRQAGGHFAQLEAESERVA